MEKLENLAGEENNLLLRNSPLKHAQSNWGCLILTTHKPDCHFPKSRYSIQKSHDISKSQIKELVEFVNSLDPKPIRRSKTHSELQLLQKGQEQFHTIGCANCHVQTVGIAKNVFSDFLLHDMGPELADASHSIRKKTHSPAHSPVYGRSKAEFEIQKPSALANTTTLRARRFPLLTCMTVELIPFMMQFLSMAERPQVQSTNIKD